VSGIAEKKMRPKAIPWLLIICIYI
jgi:hypothetical protein